jgi:hypothetical protein
MRRSDRDLRRDADLHVRSVFTVLMVELQPFRDRAARDVPAAGGLA